MFDPWAHSVGSRSGVAVSCGVGHRHILDLMLLWLWCRPVAVAPIRTLLWEPLYAVEAALKGQKDKKKNYAKHEKKAFLATALSNKLSNCHWTSQGYAVQ